MNQTFRIIISPKPEFVGTRSQSLISGAEQLGINNLTGCIENRLVIIKGDLTSEIVDRLSAELLVDPVTEVGKVEHLAKSTPSDENPNPFAPLTDHFFVDVLPLPGVTDPPAENLIRAAKKLNIELERAVTGHRFELYTNGSTDSKSASILSEQLLSNPVIQQASIDKPLDPPFVPYAESDGFVETIPLTEAAEDELLEISQTRRLSLNLEEMSAIQTWYRSEGREPTDVELEMLAQTWSEHCVHKTFKATIDYTDEAGNQTTINGILNEYIRAATEEIDKPWVKSAFVDNAGIVAFNDQFDLAFKVETHNHPSALEPFGGANTGIGGVVR
ncbi:MAG: phosphoribosylformylglycinamidine synthase subunit PurS, partial [Chloroflexota bacterium]